MNDPSYPPRSIFTVGHSNHPLDRFLELLAQHAVEVVVDTRSEPSSRFAPHFNGPDLQMALRRSQRKYLFLGKECGGRPAEREFYDTEGYVLYHRIATSERFQEGIRRLEVGVGRFRVALLCSEEDPLGCHRRLLVGRVLASRGVEVRHIRGDGQVEPEAAVGAREARWQAQETLFGEPGAREWKSIRSVSHKSRPRTSSAR